MIETALSVHIARPEPRENECTTEGLSKYPLRNRKVVKDAETKSKVDISEQHRLKRDSSGRREVDSGVRRVRKKAKRRRKVDKKKTEADQRKGGDNGDLSKKIIGESHSGQAIDRPKEEDWSSLAKKLKEEINSFRKLGNLSLPSTTQTFEISRKFFAYAHAYGQEKGHSLKVKFFPDRRIYMFCSRQHLKPKVNCHLQCDFGLKAKRNEAVGRWEFLGMDYCRDHVLHSSSRSSTNTNCFEELPLHPEPFSPPTSHSIRISLDSAPQRSISRLQAPSPPLEDRKVLSTLRDRTVSDIPPDLVLFLRSFDSSPSTLNETLDSLQNLGISSIDVLTTTLSMSQGALQKFTAATDEGIRKKLEEMANELRAELDKSSTSLSRV